MQRSFPGMILIAATLIAAAPAPKPVITIDGVASAVNLDATSRAAIAKQVTALNAGLVKFVALHRSYASASSEKRAQLMRDMTDIHTQSETRPDAAGGVFCLLARADEGSRDRHWTVSTWRDDARQHA